MISNEFKCEKDPIICPENFPFLSVIENLCVQKCDAKYFFAQKFKIQSMM